MAKRRRDTSRRAYLRAISSGLITGNRLLVYEYVYAHQDLPEFRGMVSQKDAENELGGHNQRGFGPRFAELERMLCIRDVGTRQCRYSNAEVTGYRISDTRPIVDPHRGRSSQHATLSNIANELSEIISRVKNKQLRERLEQLAEYARTRQEGALQKV